MRPLAATLSSAAAPSAFLSFLSLDFFSLKLMLWGTCAGGISAQKTSIPTNRPRATFLKTCLLS